MSDPRQAGGGHGADPRQGGGGHATGHGGGQSRPPQRPRGSNSWLVFAVGGLAVLLIGVGVFAAGVLDGDEGSGSADQAVATTGDVTTTPPSTLAVPVDEAKAVRHDSGSFSFEAPEGWESQTDDTSSAAEGAPILRSAPNIASYRDEAQFAAGFGITDLTDSPVTPEAYLATVSEGSFEPCAGFGDPPVEFGQGGFTGQIVKIGPCVATEEFSALEGRYWFIGASRPDGTSVGLVANVPDQAVEDAIIRALDTLAR